MPVALSAPILQNFTKLDGPMLRSTPPVRTASQWPSTSRSIADSIAAKLEAHAASVMKFGPRRLSRFATRPLMMLASSPGIVSSVMGGSRLSRAWCQRDRMAVRTSKGRSRNSATPVSALWNSGNITRRLVR